MSFILMASSLLISGTPEPAPNEALLGQCVRIDYTLYRGSEVLETKSQTGNCFSGRVGSVVYNDLARGVLQSATNQSLTTQICSDISYYFRDETNSFQTPFYCTDNQEVQAALTNEEEILLDIRTTVRHSY